MATADGKLEARQYLRPVRTRVSGQWQDIDTDLTKRSDGTVAPKAAAVGLAFSGGGDTPLVTLRKVGRQLALSWPGSLPAPVLDGAQATYRDVLPGVDLRMGAQADGFTQLLVVKTAQAAASSQLAQLRLKLAADGMDVKETAAGGLEALDKGAGSAVFEAPTPLMWDSSTGGGTPQQPARRRSPHRAKGKPPSEGRRAAPGAVSRRPASRASSRLWEWTSRPVRTRSSSNPTPVC
ncbi:hypothetical protein [Streptomyces sp. MOE7]|uniref:hypothetical protein n=1 Tax=Streptomyces sp. MOE7 TaxID=1961713 RepID=UPI0026D82D5C